MKNKVKVYARPSFRELRIKKGFSIIMLAHKLNISRQMIAQVERRANGISPDKAKKICELLEVEFDEIFQLVERGE